MTRTDIRIFLNHPNVIAFLRAIRLGEGTSDEMGYYRIVGGQIFVDDSRHPNVRVWIPRYQVWSTAAGAYQIINRTWINLVRQYEFDDFTPESQDEAAVALIVGRGAIDDVISGHLAEAIAKCAEEWASLPGSKAGQRTEKYADVEAEYRNHGGHVAGVA